jgi:hypothetical protein
MSLTDLFTKSRGQPVELNGHTVVLMDIELGIPADYGTSRNGVAAQSFG